MVTASDFEVCSYCDGSGYVNKDGNPEFNPESNPDYDTILTRGE